MIVMIIISIVLYNVILCPYYETASRTSNDFETVCVHGMKYDCFSGTV